MIVNSFNKYSLHPHSMPGTALSTKNSAMNKTNKFLLELRYKVNK